MNTVYLLLFPMKQEFLKAESALQSFRDNRQSQRAEVIHAPRSRHGALRKTYRASSAVTVLGPLIDLLIASGTDSILLKGLSRASADGSGWWIQGA
jgi:hypothetical protein